MPADRDRFSQRDLARREPTEGPGAGPAPDRGPRLLRRSRWTWNVGTIGGIPIRIHVTLALLLLWVALAYSLRGVGPSMTIAGVVLVACVFALVLLHELSHALVARRFGVHTRDILLLPIGGIASLERIPERPGQELAVAVVGPMVNLVIAAILAGVITLAGGDVRLGVTRSLPATVAVQLVWINVALAVFNLLPAFPLDGGRVLRALLSFKLPREQATTIAAGIGKFLALALGVFGLFYNPWLALIAIVIWIGARSEAELTSLRAALEGIPARDAMVRRFQTVRSDEPVSTAASILVGSGTGVVPVVDHGRALGVLTQSDIVVALRVAGPDTPVAQVPRHDAVAVSPEEPLDRVLEQLQTASDGVAVVVEPDGAPIGVVTAEQLASYVALHARQRREPPATI